MCLQTRIIKEYRALYPSITLRETSLQTGIQLTRIFRIYNGAAMKLAEYERFHELVHGSAASSSAAGSFQRVTEAISQQMPFNDLAKITSLLERHLQWHTLMNTGRLPESISHVITA